MTAQIKKGLPTIALTKAGFTLIELLIVIAILGVLAVVVLVAIDPVQQLARTRDAGRISSVQQLGHAVESYYASHNGTYPTTGQWTASPNILEASGEIKQIPAPPTTNPIYGNCTSNPVQNTWCYLVSGNTSFVVFAKLEAESNLSSGIGTCTVGNTEGYAVYSSMAGKGCIKCGAPPNASYACP